MSATARTCYLQPPDGVLVEVPLFDQIAIGFIAISHCAIGPLIAVSMQHSYTKYFGTE